jgi:hypothetical protein
MESQLRSMGNDTDLSGGGKGRGLEELKKDRRQRCVVGLMDWGGARPWLREK